MRKIVQIIPMPIYGGTDLIFALCDDGCVFSKHAFGGPWTKLRDLPDDKKDGEE